MTHCPLSAAKDVVILVGDVLEHLRTLPDASVDCVVTSPPYWGLRDYGVAGQLGMEATLDDHLELMVNKVFAEIWRVLKPSGTCWVNYGDCYASTANGRKAADITDDDRGFVDKPFSTIGGVLKAKDLCMMPNRFAIKMQEFGWWVRSEIIWAKPNPMPESVYDRPATSHEKIFLFTKSARYDYDARTVRRCAADSSLQRWSQDIENQKGSNRANGGAKINGMMKAVGGPKKDKQRGHSRRHAGFNDRWDKMTLAEQQSGGRNLRNYESPQTFEVWEMATRPFKDAHFATFPEALPRRCIAAGCPPGGVVLDPFGGAGTTALAAKNLGRQAILIELNPDYADIAAARLRAAHCHVDGVAQPESDSAGPLFAAQAKEAGT